MEQITTFPQKAFTYQAEVTNDGRVELSVPLVPGSRVTIIVIEENADPFHDLVQASASGLDFWDNPLDDEDWNHA